MGRHPLRPVGSLKIKDQYSNAGVSSPFTLRSIKIKKALYVSSSTQWYSQTASDPIIMGVRPAWEGRLMVPAMDGSWMEGFQETSKVLHVRFGRWRTMHATQGGLLQPICEQVSNLDHVQQKDANSEPAVSRTGPAHGDSNSTTSRNRQQSRTRS